MTQSEPTSTPSADQLFITTAIDYANGVPHIGHVFEKILADAIARYQRLAGRPTSLLLGTDEHGEKIMKAAAAQGVTPQELVDDLSQRAFQGLWERLGISLDEFVRTTDAPHQAFVQQILQRVYDAGDIYYAEYEGLYSVGAERYVTEKELAEGLDGVRRFPGDKDPPELRREANYFFKMEKYQPWLREYLQVHPDLIQPAGFRNEVMEMLREPLGDLSISRPKERISWGVPIPWDEGHVTYVWFDALLAYLSGQVNAGHPESVSGQTWHVIGKDILKPHAIFWPTMLRSAGLPVYDRLVVHSHILAADGRKMGKSLGNAIDPEALVADYPLDSVRYSLLREASMGSDTPYGEAILISRHNGELANDLGNLLARSLSMIEKYRGGVIPAAGDLLGREEGLIRDAKALPGEVLRLVGDFRLNMALDAAMNFVRDLNRYIAESEPWKLAKDEAQSGRLDTVLYTVAEGLRVASVALEAAMPGKMQELRRQLGLGDQAYVLESAWALTPAGTQIRAGEVLFPKLEVPEKPAVPQGEAPVTDTPSQTAPSQPAASQPVAAPAPTEAATETAQDITIDDFLKVDLRLAEVLACEPLENADKLLKFTLKVGGEERTILSGIRRWFPEPAELVGKRVVIVANLAPRRMRGILSQGMILSAEDDAGNLDMLTVQRDLPGGTKVR
ncbi:methionine--tRNA ligase [Deinococcus radiophilus]|uniref:methionine--tRNA ligase n=1 Tax=Deinococcus radiophilus TaxID=32062 RepID=UPI001E2EB37A|nr:methionine--tRNA ligase [Deinococcus radiophilus]UFA49421.1 methionine--tRNA ligase [Deinococcus radiophilus]